MAFTSLSVTAPRKFPRGVIAVAEFRFVLLFALVLCVVTSLPYVLGHVLTQPGKRFTDILAFDVDQNNYFAYANQAASGQWLFHNPMTGEPHGDVFFNGEWLAIGKTAAVLGVSLKCATHVMRLLSILFMCVALYWLSTYYFRSIFIRRFTLTAIMAGGGFGWLLWLRWLQVIPDGVNFYDLRAGLFPFFGSLMVPHFLVAQAFVVLGLCFFLSGECSNLLRDYALAGLCFLIAGSCRPYDMLYLLLGTSIYLSVLALHDNQLGRGMFLRALPIVMCLPLLVYYYWIFRMHPVFRWWSLPGEAAPHPVALGMNFGLAALFLVPSLWRLRRQQIGKSGTFIICCLIAASGLVYTHRFFNFSFQFVSDIAVPLVMVVMMGFEDLLTKWHRERRWEITLTAALLVLNSLTSVVLTNYAVIVVMQGDCRINVALLSSFEWIDDHSHPGDLVLADYWNSNLLPQYAHVNVFCGHYNIDKFVYKAAAQMRFFEPKTSSEFRQELVQKHRVRFVLVTTEEERQIGTMRDALFLKEVFRNEAVVIYATTAAL
jgi:hypothetical protein